MRREKMFGILGESVVAGWSLRIVGAVLVGSAVLTAMAALAPYGRSGGYGYIEPYPGDTLVILGIAAGLGLVGIRLGRWGRSLLGLNATWAQRWRSYKSKPDPGIRWPDDPDGMHRLD